MGEREKTQKESKRGARKKRTEEDDGAI